MIMVAGPELNRNKTKAVARHDKRTGWGAAQDGRKKARLELEMAAAEKICETFY